MRRGVGAGVRACNPSPASPAACSACCSSSALCEAVPQSSRQHTLQHSTPVHPPASPSPCIPCSAHLQVGATERRRRVRVRLKPFQAGLPAGAAQCAHALEQALLGGIWVADGCLVPAHREKRVCLWWGGPGAVLAGEQEGAGSLMALALRMPAGTPASPVTPLQLPTTHPPQTTLKELTWHTPPRKRCRR